MLLGRERECKALDQLLAEARAGRSAVLGISGEPGIGKTALLEYTGEQATGFRVLTARGIASEGSIPFAGLADLLRPALALLDSIPAPQAAALAGALAIAPPSERDRFAIGAATLSLLTTYAEERPLLLLVDDAHLLDRSSASALLFAARRLLADPIAVVIAAREDEASLLDGSGLRTLTLTGLQRSAVRDLLPGLRRDEADRLYDATGGNPLALLELADEPPPPEGPLQISERIASAFLERAGRLSGPTRSALLVAATCDSDDLGVVTAACRALDVPPEALADAEAIGLVHTIGGTLRFRHPLVRAALYSEADPAERRRVHAAVAGVLPDRDADRRAWHLAAASFGPDPHACRALAQAGARARDRNAFAAAAHAFARAATVAATDPERASLLFDAGSSAFLAGDPAQALTLLREARAHTVDPLLAAAVDHAIGRVMLTHEGPVRGGAELLASAASVLAETDPGRAVLMLAEATRGCMYAAATDLMDGYASRAEALAQQFPNQRARYLAALSRAIADVMGGQGQRGVSAAFTAANILKASPELEDEPPMLVWAAVGPLWLRDAEIGRGTMESALSRVRDQGALGLLGMMLHYLGRAQATTDQWAAAQSTFDESVRAARETGQTVELAAALAGRCWLDARQGREQNCRSAAAEAEELCRRLGIAFYQLWCVQALGDLELGLGNPAAALPHYLRQAELMASRSFVDVDQSPDAELVDVYLRLDRAADAAAACARQVAAAEAKGGAWSLARARRCQGMVNGDESAFEEALLLHDRTPDVFETARTRLVFGGFLRRSRRKVRAREHLHAALDDLLTLGAESWAAQASAELAATGEVARRRDVGTLVQLTPQEYQVARLLADGRTTREAAAAVFLSPKTVEYHLRSVYRKLGINSRAQLASRMEDPPRGTMG